MTAFSKRINQRCENRTGGLYQINEGLGEGSFYPRLPDGMRKNVKMKTECEQKLAKMIAEKKTEIANRKRRKKQIIFGGRK